MYVKKNITAIRIVFLTIKIKTFERNVILNTEKNNYGNQNFDIYQ